MARHGLNTHRALRQDYVSQSAFVKPGVFGRMFPTLPHVKFNPDLLKKLSDEIESNSGGQQPPPEDFNRTISAGYTFLGQFIDHDITFDPTSSLEQQNDPEAIHNFRTPMLELDSVYGSDRVASGHLYDQEERPDNPKDPRGRTAKLLIGQDAAGRPNDLPRNKQGEPLIGDPRNDENLIISQLHLAFLKFHNHVVDHLLAHGVNELVFEEAQRIVRWHYQWIIVHEFLPRIVGLGLVNDILSPQLGTSGQGLVGQTLDENLRYFVYEDEPYIPVEFAVAAYRFGHSMIRPGYLIRRRPPGSQPPVFAGAIFPDLNVNGQNLTPKGKVLLANRSIDWSAFFEMGETTTPPQQEIPQIQNLPQFSMRIDTKISPPLFDLPETERNSRSNPSELAFRNLQRGNTFRLPWGQRVAAAVGVEPLGDDQLLINGTNTKLTDLGFPAERAPLWYYILREAEVQHQGIHLGDVGGRIVCEVLLGLLHGDRNSYISQDPLWNPTKPLAGVPPILTLLPNGQARINNTSGTIQAITPGLFTISDLLKIAGVGTPDPDVPTHTVVQGETLRRIAQEQLGAEDRWIDIFLLNRDEIDHPDQIEIGQVFVLPE